MYGPSILTGLFKLSLKHAVRQQPLTVFKANTELRIWTHTQGGCDKVTRLRNNHMIITHNILRVYSLWPKVCVARKLSRGEDPTA